ncbi:hypothetical protein NX059_007908 [Plenodomus lindquistii]|nr:hypothetical protein NX059_007908 [Plenodomus lindquistii]
MTTTLQPNQIAPADARADHIRSSMSVANLITSPPPAPPAETTPQMDASLPSSLHTTTTTTSSIEDPVDSPDLIMTELPEISTHAQSAQPSETSDVTTGASGVKQESDSKDNSSGVMDESAGGDATDNADDLPDDEREFFCMNDPCGRCMTGQYTKDLSRKVISDHFGRNKACTRDILEWPLFCRKHYQRATYNKSRWQVRKIELIIRQFDLIEAQFPGTTYDIHYKKSEEARLNRYSRLVTSGMSTDEAELLVLPATGKHFEAPIKVLLDLDSLVTKGKSYEDARKLVGLISEMLAGGKTEQVPSVEFLPNIPNKTKKSPSKASSSKSPRTPKGRSKDPKSPGTPSRVSAKGSVKKTSNKA